MSYIASGDIIVFPLSKNRTGIDNGQSRLFYENNVANIIRQLLDTDGVVLTDNLDTEKPLEFNLYGYYVQVSNWSKLPNPCYASIKIDENGEITGQDVPDNGASQYQGIDFTNSEPNPAEITAFLQILDGDGNIPAESKVKFTGKSSQFSISTIDGKRGFSQ